LEAKVSLRNDDKSLGSASNKVLQVEQRHLEVLGDFTNKPLEGKLPNEEFSGFLVPPNFTESDSSGPETMGLLDTTSSCSGSLTGSGLCCELLTGGFACSGECR